MLFPCLYGCERTKAIHPTVRERGRGFDTFFRQVTHSLTLCRSSEFATSHTLMNVRRHCSVYYRNPQSVGSDFINCKAFPLMLCLFFSSFFSLSHGVLWEWQFDSSTVKLTVWQSVSDEWRSRPPTLRRPSVNKSVQVVQFVATWKLITFAQYFDFLSICLSLQILDYEMLSTFSFTYNRKSMWCNPFSSPKQTGYGSDCSGPWWKLGQTINKTPCFCCFCLQSLCLFDFWIPHRQVWRCNNCHGYILFP